MGGGTSRHTDKRVVIVGASFSGLTVAERLWDNFNVLLIDRNDFFEYTCTNPRALVKSGQIEELTLQYQKLLRLNNNKADFLQAELKRVKRTSIDVELPNGEQESVPFDYLIICTGSYYNKPIKDYEVNTLIDRKNRHAFDSEDVKKADSVLVVGGGAVGVELAAEIKHFCPTKRVGICSRSKTLLPSFAPQA